MAVTLYGRTSQSLMTLGDVLNQCGAVFVSADSPAAGLLYGPDRVLVAQLQDGQLRGPEGSVLALGPWYEARIFNPSGEVRWLNVEVGRGRTVLLSENRFDAILDRELPPIEAREVLEQTYLLWGRGDGTTPAPNWSRLVEARIGSLLVPVTGVRSGQRVVLKSREYLGRLDRHGNVGILAERLLSLEVAS